MKNTRTILEIHNLTKSFGGLIAVNGLTFSIKDKEILGIIGPNGSGKTTVLNLISGVFHPTSGSIHLGTQTITNKSAHHIARAGVARTFQLVRVLPRLSVVDNVKAGAVFGHRKKWKQQATAYAETLVTRVGLEKQRLLPVSSLTYIDQKRVELARALAGDPQVLLLDEWLAGLNPTELQIGIELIQSLSEEGRTIVLVEHVMDAIRTLCDRCIVINSGQLLAQGSPDTVLSDASVIAAYLGDD